MGSKKRPLAHTGGAPPSARHQPRTPDFRQAAGGQAKKQKHKGKQAATHSLAVAAASHYPALARPDSSRWWPPPEQFEPADDDDVDEEAVPVPPPQPQPLVAAGDWRPGGAAAEAPLPPLDRLATSAGPPGGPAAGRAVLAALIAPVSVETFMASVFEGRPLHIKHRGPGAAAAYASLFSSADLHAWVGTGAVPYATALDVVRFDGTVRHTLNYNGDAAPGQDEEAETLADPAVFARRLSAEGCSARVLHPQRRSPSLAAVMCALEGFFGCLVGCNAYLTPPNGAQGFAPHADGVGVFILQAEGRKRWRVHGARAHGEVLPLDSSPDYAPGDVGPTLLDAVLEPGDLLYLPRGMVHQADTPGGGSSGAGGSEARPSLHLTLSVSDGRGGGTWADVLAIALPRALEIAAGRCTALRRAVPPGVVGWALGVAAEDSAARAATAAAASAPSPAPPYAARAAARAAAQSTATRAAAAVLAALPIDAAADALAADFVRKRLPPPRPDATDGPCPPAVRPVAEGTAARLVVEAGAAVVYHCMDNDIAAHAAGADEGDGDEEEERGRIVLPLEAAPAVEALLGVHSARPGFSPVVLAEIVESLGGGEEAEAAVAGAADALWGSGLLEPVG